MEGFCEAGNGSVLLTVSTPCFARGLPSLR